jgi:hypothetical protein
LAADLRIAAQDAVFNQGEVTAASFPGGGATVRFVREAGWGNAMRYMLTGEDWQTDEAYRMGLVQIITPPGQQFDRAVDLAKHIAAYAPLGVQALLGSARAFLAIPAPRADTSWLPIRTCHCVRACRTNAAYFPLAFRRRFARTTGSVHAARVTAPRLRT